MDILRLIKSIKNMFHGNIQEERDLLLQQILISIYQLDEHYREENRPKKYSLSIRRLLPGDWLEETNRRINNTITFVVRSSEMRHNKPHFKITIRGKGSGLYSLETLQPIKSNIRKEDEKDLLTWASEHRSEMYDLWNKFIGHRIIVE